MMRIALMAVLMLFSFVATAQPVAYAEPPAEATHCVFTIDSLAPVVVTVNVVIPMNCKTDVGAVAIGPHTVKVRSRRVDAIWGNVESVDTPPLNFTKPGALVAPTILMLKAS